MVQYRPWCPPSPGPLHRSTSTPILILLSPARPLASRITTGLYPDGLWFGSPLLFTCYRDRMSSLHAAEDDLKHPLRSTFNVQPSKHLFLEYRCGILCLLSRICFTHTRPSETKEVEGERNENDNRQRLKRTKADVEPGLKNEAPFSSVFRGNNQLGERGDAQWRPQEDYHWRKPPRLQTRLRSLCQHPAFVFSCK